MLKSKPTREKQLEHLSSVAVATGVPIIVVSQYFGELYGFCPELTSYMSRLKHFYKITELKGCKDI